MTARTTPACAPRRTSPKAIFAGLLIALAMAAGTAIARPVFTQLTDSLEEGIPLVGQNGWALRSAQEVSPVVAQFLNHPAIVVSGKEDSGAVVAVQRHLEPNNLWQTGRSFTLEFDVAISDAAGEPIAMVGIGWTGGGIPAHIGISGDRIALRQRHFGKSFYGREASGTIIQLKPGEWARIRATFTRESETQAPAVSISVATDSAGQDFRPVCFEINGGMSEPVPIADDAEADLYENMNLLWLRVKGSAAIRDITLTDE